MSSQENELYKKIEIQRISLINEIKGLDKALLNKREHKGSWNIPEVLGHLIQAEQLALSYVKKKMTVIDELKYAGLRSSFNINILRIVLSLPFKYKAPQVSVPENAMPFEDLEEEWANIRSELKDILDQNGYESRRLLYKHPFAGRMNLIQMMQFFKAHINHHIKQIQRIKKSL